MGMYCTCHGAHGLPVKANGADGLCATCRFKGPEVCVKAHKREKAQQLASNPPSADIQVRYS